MSTNAVAAGPMHALNDWSRPMPVRRFGVLVEKTGAEPWAGLTALGPMVWPEGKDVAPGAELAGWPDNPRAVRTEVWAGYDAGNLYLRVVCEEPELGRMQAGNEESSAQRSRGGLHRSGARSLAVPPVDDPAGRADGVDVEHVAQRVCAGGPGGEEGGGARSGGGDRAGRGVRAGLGRGCDGAVGGDGGARHRGGAVRGAEREPVADGRV